MFLTSHIYARAGNPTCGLFGAFQSRRKFCFKFRFCDYVHKDNQPGSYLMMIAACMPEAPLGTDTQEIWSATLYGGRRRGLETWKALNTASFIVGLRHASKSCVDPLHKRCYDVWRDLIDVVFN